MSQNTIKKVYEFEWEDDYYAEKSFVENMLKQYFEYIQSRDLCKVRELEGINELC